MPKAARGIDSCKYSFRRRAFAAWKEKHGTTTVPFFVECKIDSATRHHKNALLIEWLIRTTENPPAAEFQAMLDKSASFTDSRDKALQTIGLGPATDQASPAGEWGAMLAATRNQGPMPPAAPQSPQGFSGHEPAPASTNGHGTPQAQSEKRTRDSVATAGQATEGVNHAAH